MLTRSNTYRTILADAGHTVEWRVTVNGTVYGQDKLIFDAGGGDSRPKISRSLISGGEPTVGECIAATFSCAVREASGAIPRMAAVSPAYRLVLGSQESEWITLGTFFIDTRQTDKVTGALMLTCYDRMLVADGAGGKNYADLTGFTEWPQSMASVAAEIATIMGVTIDARTVINSGSGYVVDYPGDYTMREVLGYIAAAHAGNWTVTSAGKLRLVPLTGTSDSITLGTDANGLCTSPALTAWSGVIVYYADEAAFSSGDDSGRVLTCDCPWATQDTADGILASLSGAAYQPYTAQGAIIDLALELGDVVTVGLPGETVTGPVMSIDITASALEQADIEAPGEDEIDHEYPYASYVDRSLKRKVTLGQSYYGTSISRDKGLFIARSDGKSDVTLNSDRMVFRGRVDGVMVDQIYFDTDSGRYYFNGALGSDAIFTDSLYAERGDVAELTVDRLSTSKRIRKYLLRDTSDDNYILIQDRSIKFITATVTGLYIRLLTEDNVTIIAESGDYLDAEAQGSSSFEIAKNRYGQNLYWEENIESAEIDSDGYPYIDGRQIYVTTQHTGFPVYVYQYSELVKAEYSFIESNGTYVPVQIWGAGSGYADYGKGFIEKLTDKLQLSYKTRSGVLESIQLNDDGWVDINSLRKPLTFDFSDFENGSFTETIDGGMTIIYTVTFDNQGRVVSIRDGAGHLTEVIW